ncbi:hypothetical protein [Metaclostridioides mangenotii]|uniref:hypothetical protein n=1 Tax=Metaclostridioides mangenotii TaxID=1540 RepID=UPI0004B1B593|nr:hypothetical protein [Clostridioides mangenotii]
MDKFVALEKLKTDYKNMIIPSKLDYLINENTIDSISNIILVKIKREKFGNIDSDLY